MTLQDELKTEPTEADEAAFFAGVDKVVNEIRELAEKHGVNNGEQPDISEKTDDPV